MKKFLLASFFTFFAFFTQAQNCEIFREDFNGSSSFTDTLFPYGTPPSTCLYAVGGSSSNRGKEQWMTLVGYTDFEIKRSGLNFPADDYVILCKWRDSVNATTKEDCSITNLDDAFGASCVTPNRIWAINGQMVHQHPGPPNKKSKTFFAKYKGPINKIEIAMNGGCSIYTYDMWVDYIAIVGSAKLPKIKIEYKILDSGRVQFMDSSMEVDNNPPLWNFSDGQQSTEISPIITFDTLQNKMFYACLTRSNTCATDSICVLVDFLKTDSIGDTTGTGISIRKNLNTKFIDLKYSAENKNILLKNMSNESSTIFINDLNGKRIFQSTIQAKESKVISLMQIPSGFYTVTYFNNVQAASDKFLIY